MLIRESLDIGTETSRCILFCWQKAAEASDEALWTIWTAAMYYCAKCAKQEGIGPNQF